MSTIRLSINADLIKKEMLFVGKKGRYLDLVLIPTPNSEYGDYMVKQSIPYEERQSGKEGVIFGNAKISVPRAGGMPVDEPPVVDEDQDLPF